MAIFEKRNEKVRTLDDTQSIICVIETAQDVKGHTEYLLRFQRGPFKDNCWKILRRYNDFDQLDKCLRISNINLPMPAKKIIGKMRPDFIAQRRQALQEYINTVLMNPILASSLPTKRFVDPDSYSQSFHDQAVQNASLCLRSDGQYALGATLGPIGWRLRKHYFKVLPKPSEKSSNKLLVKSGSQSHHSKHFSFTGYSGSLDSGMLDPSEVVLEWVEFGPDRYIDDKELVGVMKSLVGLQHKNIENILYTSQNENGCLIIRKFYKQGSLKDVLCMSTPKNPFLSKYGNPKGRTALTMKQVANYGRQILEALTFLHSKGFPYGHLHSGNIVIADECVKLLDIENYILGVPAFYRPFFVQHSKIHTIENIDVYCFGHVLFEMAMGYPLQESIARQISDCPDHLKNLLESILSKDACRAGLPLLADLLKHPFFTQYTDSSVENASFDDSNKPHFKLSLNAKEQLRLAMLKYESRLRDEQKSVKNQKRIVRVQEFMSSEEEKRKIKQKAKLEQKQSKLKQQVSLQTSNGRMSLSSTCSVSNPHTSSFNRSDSIMRDMITSDMNERSVTSQTEGVLCSSPTCSSKQISGTKEIPYLSHVERQLSSPSLSITDQSDTSRSVLLESICKFNRGSLRKVRSND